MDAEGGGVGVGEGEGAGVGHVVARGIVVGGGQLQAVALLAAIALGTPVSQLPCSCERAAQFHVLPVGVALLAVDGDGLAGLPFAHSCQCAVGLEGEALEVSLRVADVLERLCAVYEAQCRVGQKDVTHFDAEQRAAEQRGRLAMLIVPNLAGWSL